LIVDNVILFVLHKGGSSNCSCTESLVIIRWDLRAGSVAMFRLTISAVAASFAAVALAGCLSTQEMPLAPNVVRIDTQAGGWLFTGQAVPATMRAAAKATLDRGYTHFKFTDASLGQGSVVTGTVGSSNTNLGGNYGAGFMNASATSYGSTSVMRAPTAGAAVTVVMFHANEPDAKGAFEAEQILKQYSQ
jgi:hypothetical protein